MVEIGEAKEGLNVLDFPQFGPIKNCLDFIVGHREPRWGKDISKVFKGLRVPFAFLWLEVKFICTEASEDILDQAPTHRRFECEGNLLGRCSSGQIRVAIHTF